MVSVCDPKFVVLLLPLMLFAANGLSAAAPVKADCSKLNNSAKDFCLDQVKAYDKLALAELAYRQAATSAHAYAVSTAKADVAYADYKSGVAKCETMALDTQSNCVRVAREKFKKGS